MKTITMADIAAYLQTTHDFKPFIRKHSDFRDQIEAALDPQMQERHPTVFSVQQLQGKLQFRPAEVSAWAGYNGHRKSMFLGQVCADLLVQKKPVLICSMEMHPSDTLARMARQMSASAKPTKAWLDRWAAWTDRLWLLDYQGRIDPDTMVAACRWFASQVVSPHIVIDSMMMVCSSEEHLDQQKQFMTDLVRFAQESGAHVHLVAHCRKPARDGEDQPPSKYELRGSAAISDQAHNVITVWANKLKQKTLEKRKLDDEERKVLDERDAVITVEKQRNGRWEGMATCFFDEQTLRFCDDRVSRVEPYTLEAKDAH